MSSNAWVERVLQAMQVPGMRRLFVLGCFERRVTIYSQQVRALNLVDALLRAREMKPGDAVAVVGAGAAGLTFAAGAAKRGVEVTVIEREEGPLSLFRKNPKRWLHPRVYDWPLPGWEHARAGSGWRRGMCPGIGATGRRMISMCTKGSILRTRSRASGWSRDVGMAR